MASDTFNKGFDHFGLETATTNAVKVKSSNENRSIQTASGANTYGDTRVVDSYAETAAPSAEYEVVSQMSYNPQNPTFTIGAVIAAADSGISVGGTAVPVVIGSVQISTQTGSAPKIIVSGQAVQAGATSLRTYVLPSMLLSPRHRAQDFFSYGTPLCVIKKTVNSEAVAADAGLDYGLESVNANFLVEFTLAQPKGELKNYDLHGGMATVDYTMNWYASGAPTIELRSSIQMRTSSASDQNVTAIPVTMTAPVAKSCPEGGYTQYTWQCSFPLIGYETPTTPATSS